MLQSGRGVLEGKQLIAIRKSLRCEPRGIPKLPHRLKETGYLVPTRNAQGRHLAINYLQLLHRVIAERIQRDDDVATSPEGPLARHIVACPSLLALWV